MSRLVILVTVLAVASALPTKDKIIRKLDPGVRYQYEQAADGTPHLVDLWQKTSDIEEAARFDPDRQNVYHLFTRNNPSQSQPLLLGVDGLLTLTNYEPHRRTIVLLHGWQESVATSGFLSVVVPAFLAAEDVNIVAVDWSGGAETINYIAAISNTVACGESVARFLTWMMQASSSGPSMYHVVGHSLGGHMAGVIGRNLPEGVAYITALDPSFTGWITNSNKLRPRDGHYTEVIHTNAGLLGYIGTLGHADFYPNGGINMPGCNSQVCDHDRSFFFLAESLTTTRLFTGRRCATYITAMTGSCLLPGSLHMGGLRPKTGQSGIFHLRTNASPPFSRG